MEIRAARRRFGIRCAAALAACLPAASAFAAQWWIVSASGDQSPRYSVFADEDSIRTFDNPDPAGGRQLAAIEMKVVREDGTDAVEETHVYQIDCEQRKLRVAALFKHPRRTRELSYDGSSFYRVSRGTASVELSNARSAQWETPHAHFQQQAVLFVCEPDMRTRDGLFGQLSIGDRDPVSLVVTTWDVQSESRLRGASQEATP